MKAKDFIQEKITEFEYDEDLTLVWDELRQDLPKKNILGKGAIILVLGMLLLLIALIFIYQNSNNDIDPKSETEVLYASNIANSTSDKLLAIHNLSGGINIDKDISEALIYTLREDESINVKMAAAKALDQYMSMENVRIAVIEELELSNNTYLKIKLINLLKKAKVKESLPALDKIIEGKEGFLLKEAVMGKESILSI